MNKLTLSVAAIALTAASSFAATPAEIINNTKASVAPDSRQIVYEITPEQLPDGQVILRGKTSEQDVKNILLQAFENDGKQVIDSVTVLPSDRWAQVRISVCCFRTGPAHAAEMATQGIMGQPIRLLEKDGDWWRAQTPDGYIAYVVDNSLAEKSDDQMRQWRSAPRVIVTAPYQTHVYYNAVDRGPRDVVSDVVLGNILEGTYDPEAEVMEVTLPDGRKGFIATADVQPLDTWAQQGFDAEKILDTAYSMEGTPYLWGGTSIKTLDCSGLAKVSYFSNGIILMRDASQQALTGNNIAADQWPTCQAGDLLFFGNPKTGKVTHVAIYDHDGDYIHSSGRVRRNSVDPESEKYLTTPFLHATRIKDSIGTNGITTVAAHPWYF
ncbi:MAG: C40 family peptidase [Muribaculaceae bacterium]|nr:C40 family peptidase [Muribaculaceae bacterium]